MSIHSPSKFTRLDHLEQIRRDHYLGSGKEYSEEETDRLIWQKHQRKAEAAELDFLAADSEVERSKVRVIVMPPYPTVLDRISVELRREQNPA